jgi:hypothetical protein
MLLFFIKFPPHDAGALITTTYQTQCNQKFILNSRNSFTEVLSDIDLTTQRVRLTRCTDEKMIISLRLPSSRLLYLPIKIMIPAANATIPMTIEGIAKPGISAIMPTKIK